MDRHVVVGTAGHIDHGKSRLVLALTGTDPDRWEEEKRRGITIDLGFAHLEHDTTRFGFVDVPGHERFVHNMLAGVTGIDLVLLVVAADESVMPQTIEHLAICDLLGVRGGLVAITRIDVAEEGLADLVEADVREAVAGTFLEDAPVLRVSGATGEGLDALADALVAAAGRLAGRGESAWPRLPIDRVFAAKGHGTVVTGTLQGGSLRVGDALVAAPGGHACRVRGLQVHGHGVETAGPHQRVAVNLQGVERADLRRGLCLAPRGCEVTTKTFDATIRVIEAAPCELAEGMRVRVHHGTAEVMARLRLPDPGRLEPGQAGVCQIRLEEEIAVLPGDRFVVRRSSPVTTLGGGVVADLDPPRWRRASTRWAERTRALVGAKRVERLGLAAREAGATGLSLRERARRLALGEEEASEWASSPAAGRGAFGVALLAKDRLVSTAGLDTLIRRVRNELARFHADEPMESGMPLERLRTTVAPGWTMEAFREALETPAASKKVEIDGALAKVRGHRVEIDPGELARLDAWVSRLEDNGTKPMDASELLGGDANDARAKELLVLAGRQGRVLRLKDDLWLGRRAYEDIVSRLVEEAESGRETLDVPRFKEIFGLSRKYAIPLLELLDDRGVTRRAGNQRVVRREARSSSGSKR